MSDRRRGLGRGLGALFPPATGATTDTPGGPSGSVGDGVGGTGSAAGSGPAGSGTELSPGEQADSGAYFAELPLDQVVPNPRQPRTVFDQDDLEELVRSIREVGLLQPVVVRQAGPGRYELVMGERRWRAAREAGLTALPAIVRPTEDEDLLRDALLENLHRSQLNPLEEAAAYDQLLEDFGCTHEELARRLGRSRPQISNTLRLLKLPPAVQRRVAAGVLSAGHARALLALEGSEAREHLAQRVVAEGLSVRSVEEIVAVGDERSGAGRVAATGRRPPAASSSPAAAAAAERLTDLLDTRVRVDVGRRKGRIVVEFASGEDLDRIVTLLTGQHGTD